MWNEQENNSKNQKDPYALIKMTFSLNGTSISTQFSENGKPNSPCIHTYKVCLYIDIFIQIQIPQSTNNMQIYLGCFSKSKHIEPRPDTDCWLPTLYLNSLSNAVQHSITKFIKSFRWLNFENWMLNERWELKWNTKNQQIIYLWLHFSQTLNSTVWKWLVIYEI